MVHASNSDRAAWIAGRVSYARTGLCHAKNSANALASDVSKSKVYQLCAIECSLETRGTFDAAVLRIIFHKCMHTHTHTHTPGSQAARLLIYSMHIVDSAVRCQSTVDKILPHSRSEIGSIGLIGSMDTRNVLASRIGRSIRNYFKHSVINSTHTKTYN